MFDYTTTARIQGFEATLIEMLPIRREQHRDTSEFRHVLQPLKNFNNISRFRSEMANCEMRGTLTEEGLHIHSDGELRPSDWLVEVRRLAGTFLAKIPSNELTRDQKAWTNRTYRVDNLISWSIFDRILGETETTFTLTMEDLSQ